MMQNGVSREDYAVDIELRPVDWRQLGFRQNQQPNQDAQQREGTERHEKTRPCICLDQEARMRPVELR